MDFLNTIRNVMHGEVREIVDSRIKGFRELWKKDSRELFKELCFCILTANFNAERSIEIQERLGDDFLDATKEELEEKLKISGHRYPATRAGYIVEARRFKDSIKDILSSIEDREGKREWLVRNIKGIGYKEASHFLRNIGYLDYAIVDFHIIDLLEREGLIKRPKGITKKKYFYIESLLKNIARSLNIPVGELDLYLWYMETGKVLK